LSLKDNRAEGEIGEANPRSAILFKSAIKNPQSEII